jgi:hypothetical protein
VLFDTPSTVVFSDGPMLASWIDTVVMVVSANQVSRGTEAQTRDLLRRAKANIIGVVVNRMASDNVDSCHFYASYYEGHGAPPAGDELQPAGVGEVGPTPKARTARPKSIAAPKAPSEEADQAVEPGGADANPEPTDNPFPE